MLLLTIGYTLVISEYAVLEISRLSGFIRTVIQRLLLAESSFEQLKQKIEFSFDIVRTVLLTIQFNPGHGNGHTRQYAALLSHSP